VLQGDVVCFQPRGYASLRELAKISLAVGGGSSRACQSWAEKIAGVKVQVVDSIKLSLSKGAAGGGCAGGYQRGNPCSTGMVAEVDGRWIQYCPRMPVAFQAWRLGASVK
jgi:hypothetical protein